MQRKAACVGRESNPGQLLGRQLCSPLYHQRYRDTVKGTGCTGRDVELTGMAFVFQHKSCHPEKSSLEVKKKAVSSRMAEFDLQVGTFALAQEE